MLYWVQNDQTCVRSRPIAVVILRRVKRDCQKIVLFVRRSLKVVVGPKRHEHYGISPEHPFAPSVDLGLVVG